MSLVAHISDMDNNIELTSMRRWSSKDTDQESVYQVSDPEVPILAQTHAQPDEPKRRISQRLLKRLLILCLVLGGLLVLAGVVGLITGLRHSDHVRSSTSTNSPAWLNSSVTTVRGSGSETSTLMWTNMNNSREEAKCL